MTTQATIYFYGGAGTVTGANFLFEIMGKRILIDCGILQGDPEAVAFNSAPFPYDPSKIDMLFITHAHADHIGRIPKLVRDGFNGVIYSTEPTRSISNIVLHDTVGLLLEQSEVSGIDPIYTMEDVERTMQLWKVESYHHAIDIAKDVVATMHDAGHILGSAMIKFSYNGENIVFTGDLGNSPSPILRDTEVITDADYLIMESVYGDRNHEHRGTRSKFLEQTLQEVISRKGVVMIPMFAVERTQEFLYEINAMVESGHISTSVPIYVDSPLAIHITEVYRRSTEYFNNTAKARIKSGDDIFNFPNLHMTESVEASKGINETPSPKIIMAGSGMLDGGRMLHHLRRYISDPKNLLLFVGYQAVGTLGRMIVDGARHITIAREKHSVRAQIMTLTGYSGHKQMDDLVEFVHNTQDRIKKVWCVMGEPSSSMFLAQRLRDYLGIKAFAPEADEVVHIELGSKS